MVFVSSACDALLQILPLASKHARGPTVVLREFESLGESSLNRVVATCACLSIYDVLPNPSVCLRAAAFSLQHAFFYIHSSVTEQEAEHIVSEVQRLIAASAGVLSYQHFAVLYR